MSRKSALTSALEQAERAVVEAALLLSEISPPDKPLFVAEQKALRAVLAQSRWLHALAVSHGVSEKQ